MQTNTQIMPGGRSGPTNVYDANGMRHYYDQNWKYLYSANPSSALSASAPEAATSIPGGRSVASSAGLSGIGSGTGNLSGDPYSSGGTGISILPDPINQNVAPASPHTPAPVSVGGWGGNYNPGWLGNPGLAYGWSGGGNNYAYPTFSYNDPSLGNVAVAQTPGGGYATGGPGMGGGIGGGYGPSTVGMGFGNGSYFGQSLGPGQIAGVRGLQSGVVHPPSTR